jgi:nickel-type superoxide dismutase maturation protease
MIKETSYKELFLWLLGKRQRLRVTGESMLPLLKPGEEILVDSQAYQNSCPQIGDLVVAIHPHHSELRIVKRVILTLEDGSCFLQGDNSAGSSDSRSFGAVNLKQIVGKVTSRFP